MYIYIYTFTHVYIYTYTHIYICTQTEERIEVANGMDDTTITMNKVTADTFIYLLLCIYERVYVYIYIYTQIYIYTYTHIYICTMNKVTDYTFIYLSLCICERIHVYTCIYTYTHVYKYTYTHIYICPQEEEKIKVANEMDEATIALSKVKARKATRIAELTKELADSRAECDVLEKEAEVH